MKKLVIISFILVSQLSQAQCAMCKAVVESGGDVSKAEGLNSGIFYLLVFPYFLVGTLLYFVIKKIRKNN